MDVFEFEEVVGVALGDEGCCGELVGNGELVEDGELV